MIDRKQCIPKPDFRLENHKKPERVAPPCLDFISVTGEKPENPQKLEG